VDPVTLGILLGVAVSGAATALGLRRGRKPAARAQADRRVREGEIQVGAVLTHLGDEYWLAGEVSFVREGSAALRVFVSPQRGGDRWVALTRDATAVWFLDVAPDLAAIGWPGVEVAVSGKLLRRVETGTAVVSTAGESVGGWGGSGRFATFRGAELVALFAEASGQKLALLGNEVPRALIQQLG
jgi:hypothetical protein